VRFPCVASTTRHSDFSSPIAAMLRFLRTRLPSLEAPRSPRFLGDPSAACRTLRPRRRPAPGLTVPGCCLPRSERRRLPGQVFFRGSIARPTPSLSTLRARSRLRPRKTRFRLDATPSPGGLIPQGPSTRFHQPSMTAPPRPGFAWRTRGITRLVQTSRCSRASSVPWMILWCGGESEAARYERFVTAAILLLSARTQRAQGIA
jgi:hypothetical protein